MMFFLLAATIVALCMVVPTPVKTLKPLQDGIREGHVVLLGMTKYGKTTLARHLFLTDDLFDRRKNPVSIFLDT